MNGWSGRGSRLAVWVGAAALAAAFAYFMLLPADGAEQGAAGSAAKAVVQEVSQGMAALDTRLASGQAPVGQAAAPPAPVPLQAGQAAPLNEASQAALQRFAVLNTLPPGDAAIAWTQQLEADITPANTAGYVQALLSAGDPAVERAAIAALARVGDADAMKTLAAAYGTLPAQSRGRVLQVLESAANPQALAGLAGIFNADSSEKRSPLAVSALYGMAHIGNMDAVGWLLQQLTPTHADYALMALERVRSPQGLAMIRAAAEGSKDVANMPEHYRPALKRLAGL